ncbi:MAG: hypothetical protein EOO40_00230 [Deltaproteobacteria bacterium]|nr:MAG: hypothetical protein EOO40_00230 [Deltaproteobacteria bacterium]
MEKTYGNENSRDHAIGMQRGIVCGADSAIAVMLRVESGELTLRQAMAEINRVSVQAAGYAHDLNVSKLFLSKSY